MLYRLIRRHGVYTLIIFIVLFSAIPVLLGAELSPWDIGSDGTRGRIVTAKQPEIPHSYSQRSDVYSMSKSVCMSVGAFSFSEQDIFIPGRIPLQLTRHYNSRDNVRNGLFGYGWTFNYSHRILEIKNDETGSISAVLLNPDGKRTVFEFRDGTYVPPPGVYITLTKNNGAFTLRDKHGNTIQFDTQGNAWIISDPNGNNITITNQSGAIDKITDASGRTLTFTYGANGKVSTMTYPDPFDPAGKTFTYHYDAAGDLIKTVNPVTGATLYTYDNHHNLLAVIDPSGNKVMGIAYDASGRTASFTDSEGETWTYLYTSETQRQMSDSGGNLWKYTLDSDGRIIERIDPLGNTFSTIYNAFGKLERITDENGGVTKFEYDDRGNITKRTDALNNTTLYTYSTDYNKVTSITDPLGNKTSYQYDTRGNRINMTNALNQTTTFGYNAQGDLISITDAKGNVTAFTCDGYGNTATVKDALFNVATMGYDVRSNLTTFSAPNNTNTQYTYDALNRLIKIQDHLGGQTFYEYDWNSNLKKIIDPNGNVTEYTYTANNQLATIKNAVSGTITYGYSKGLLKTTTDANGNITSFEYDPLRRLKKIIYPDASQQTFSCDNAGNLASVITRKGQTIRYGYDLLNRLVSKTYPDNSQTTYSYDAVNLKTSSNVNRTITYQYDALNRLTTVTQDGKTVRYEYDSVGNRTRLIYPDGTDITYLYDLLNRLDQIKDPTGQVVADFSYDKLSRKTGISLDNNTQTIYQYDQLNRLQAITNRVTSTLAELSSYGYTFDQTFNPRTMVTAAGTHNYTYDAVYQLKRADYPAGYAFTDTDYNYDSTGNRTSRVSGATVTYGINNMNQYTTVGASVYTYDANGNLVSDSVHAFTYDPEDRLIQASTLSGNVSYAYDANGKRVSRTDTSGTTKYIYDRERIIAEYDQNNTLLRKYVYADNSNTPLFLISGVQRHYYYYNGLGSASELADKNQVEVETYTYDDFGNIVIKNGAGTVISQSAFGNCFAFAGQLYDTKAQLYYLNTRYYSPAIGRYLQSDLPAALYGTNPYAYELNRPTTFARAFNFMDMIANRYAIPVPSVPGPMKQTISDHHYNVLNIYKK